MSNNEVTLKIIENMDDFIHDLEEKGYKKTAHFFLYDIFMIPEEIDIKNPLVRDIISKCIIIRKVDDKTNNEIRKDISFKMKKYNDIGEILEQKSIRLKVFDCEDAERFMNAIGYKKIMNINEEDICFEKDGMVIATKNVENGDKMIEIETQPDNDKFDTIDKLKKWLKKQNFKLDFSNYFVKKAEIELQKVLKR